MSKFTDSLRGYAYDIHQRDKFICQFCGLDGTESFDKWLSLTQDHLLPKGHAKRDDKDYIVTACSFCNTADNRYFDFAKQRGLIFDNSTPEELVSQRLPFVTSTRQAYFDFWRINVSEEGE